jgi:hypothetical protein
MEFRLNEAFPLANDGARDCSAFRRSDRRPMQPEKRATFAAPPADKVEVGGKPSIIPGPSMMGHAAKLRTAGVWLLVALAGCVHTRQGPCEGGVSPNPSPEALPAAARGQLNIDLTTIPMPGAAAESASAEEGLPAYRLLSAPDCQCRAAEAAVLAKSARR